MQAAVPVVPVPVERSLSGHSLGGPALQGAPKVGGKNAGQQCQVQEELATMPKAWRKKITSQTN